MSFVTRKPADFASAVPDAGSIDTSALTHLREHDYGPSLMDRAQSQRQALAGIGAGTQTLLLQAATSSLPQEAQLAALDRQSAQLADAERTQAGYRRLRERYDPDELDRSLQQVGAIADPVKQRESLTRLQASYATFAFHPELARRIDAQFAEFEPVVQRREDAALRAAILAGRYAPTLADARQIYPGRKINTLMAPGSKTPVYVPERFADPDLEAEAVQVIQSAYHLAKVTGRRSHLEAALDDEAVRQVSRIPGNRASLVFEQAMEAFPAIPLAAVSAADVGAIEADGVAPNSELRPFDMGSDGSITGSRGGEANFGKSRVDIKGIRPGPDKAPMSAGVIAKLEGDEDGRRVLARLRRGDIVILIGDTNQLGRPPGIERTEGRHLPHGALRIMNLRGTEGMVVDEALIRQTARRLGVDPVDLIRDVLVNETMPILLAEDRAYQQMSSQDKQLHELKQDKNMNPTVRAAAEVTAKQPKSVYNPSIDRKTQRPIGPNGLPVNPLPHELQVPPRSVIWGLPP